MRIVAFRRRNFVLVSTVVFILALLTVRRQEAALDAVLAKMDVSIAPPFDENLVLSPAHFEAVGSSLARAFSAWPSDRPASWCVLEEGKWHPRATTGLLYVKTPKTGSSTISGMTQRIAISQGERSYHNGSVCRFRKDHASPNFYENRDLQHSFLWTSVRHPSKRAMSRVFYTYVTHRKWPTDDASILRALDTKSWQMGAVSQGAGGHQLKYISMDSIPNWSAWNATNVTKVLDPARVRRNVKNALQAYNFVMVSDRMDESIVVLQLLLGVETGDMLSTSAKMSGEYSIFDSECVKLTRSFVSPGVKAFLTSNEWYAKNYGDFLLYAAANKSLDLTIARLGRARFDAAMAEYQRLKGLVDDICSPKLVLPCTADGVAQEALAASYCYNYDEGCGYQCMNELLVNVTASTR